MSVGRSFAVPPKGASSRGGKQDRRMLTRVYADFKEVELSLEELEEMEKTKKRYGGIQTDT